MNRNKQAWRVLVTFVVLILTSLPTGIGGGLVAAEDKPAIKFAVLAFRPKPETIARWQPLVDYLNDAGIGRRFTLEALTYPEIEAAVQARQVGIVLTQPAHYILLANREGLYSPLATLIGKEDNHQLASFGGAIVVRADQPEIRGVAELRGKRIAVSDTESLGGYLMQAMELLQQDISLPEDARVITTGVPHDKTIQELLAGRADAAFVRTGVIEAMQREGKLDYTQIRVLNAQNVANFPFALSTRLYPEWALSAMPWLDGETTRKVAVAMLGLPHGSRVTNAAGIHGFTIPGNYQPVEELMRQLRVPPFQSPPRFTMEDVWLRYQTWIALATSLGLISLLMLSAALLRSNRDLKNERVQIKQAEEELKKYSMHLEELVDARSAALRVAEARYRTVADFTYNWETWIDTDGAWLYCSPSSLRLTGHEADEFMRRPELFLEIVHPADRPDVIAHLAEHQCSSGVGQITFRIIRPDGTIAWIEHDCQPVYGEQERCLGRRASNRDISDRKQAENELIKARDAAMVANVAKSAFLANMSHEMRTPLHQISGMAQLVRRDPLTPRQVERMDKLDAALRHMISMIEKMLELTKIEAGQFDLAEEPIEIETLLRNVTSMLHDKAEAKGLQLLTETEVTSSRFLGDTMHIQAALLNLADNAVKFTDSGSIVIWVRRVVEDATGILLRFEVEDTGIGIAPDVLPKLFSYFEQADNSTTRKYGGTGIGLAMVRKLAQIMGGDAGCNSTLGAGSTFWFTVRLKKA